MSHSYSSMVMNEGRGLRLLVYQLDRLAIGSRICGGYTPSVWLVDVLVDGDRAMVVCLLAKQPLRVVVGERRRTGGPSVATPPKKFREKNSTLTN